MPERQWLSGVATCAVVLLGAVAGLAGCERASAPAAPADIVRPALIHTVAATDDADKLRFPGRLRAARRAELSFEVPGSVAEFPLREGAAVKAGQVVARLDDALFKARVSAARAEFERAQTDLARYQRLWETESAVARSEVDDRRSRLETARTNLAAAERDLAATVIKAPFAGVLTRRRLETFTNVQAKQAIADLQDLQALEVVINVPERVLRSERPQRQAVGMLEGFEGGRLPLVLKSFAAEADPQTQTYEIVLTVQSQPPGVALLPGMSVTVLPFVERPAAGASQLMLPLTAVVSDDRGGTFVWVVGSEGVAERRKIAVGAIHGGSVSVDRGLKGGERVVAAGGGSVREGMKLRALDAR